jgi:death on curing protein
LNEPVFLRLDEVVGIHNDQIELYGGSPGIRDLELLKSAIAMPSVGFGGEYLHTDIFEMAAAYLFHIVRNHPFVDGNKRTGAVAVLVFLRMNGMELCAEEETYANLVFSVAEGKTDKPGITRFIKEFTVNNPIPKPVWNPDQDG